MGRGDRGSNTPQGVRADAGVSPSHGGSTTWQYGGAEIGKDAGTSRSQLAYQEVPVHPQTVAKQVSLPLWVWLVFGYGVLVWGSIGCFHFIRYIVRRHPLSLFIASIPSGFLMANMLYLGIVPKWLGVPFLLTANAWASFMLLFIGKDIRKRRAIKKALQRGEEP